MEVIVTLSVFYVILFTLSYLTYESKTRKDSKNG